MFRAQGRGGAATAGVFIEVRCPGGTCPTASPAPSSGAFVNGTSRGALATDACRWGSGHRLRVVVARSFAEIQALGERPGGWRSMWRVAMGRPEGGPSGMELLSGVG